MNDSKVGGSGGNMQSALLLRGSIKCNPQHTFSIVCEGHTEEEGADGVIGPVNAPPF